MNTTTNNGNNFTSKEADILQVMQKFAQTMPEMQAMQQYVQTMQEIQKSMQEMQKMHDKLAETPSTTPKVKPASALPKGIIEHQGGYLARWQYNCQTYSLFDKDLNKLITKFDNLKYEVRHGSYQPPTKENFGDWSKRWLEEHRVYNGPRLRKASVRNYTSMLKNCVPKSIKKKGWTK